jgi:rubrerythrin
MATRRIEEEDIPSLPRKAIERSFRESRARERELSQELDDLFGPITDSYLEELTGHFFTNFGKDIDPSTKQPIWSLTTAKENDSIEDLSESYRDMMNSLQDEAIDIMDEELTSELEESFDYGLWSLYQSGVDVDEVEGLGGFDERKAMLLAAGVLGVSYVGRLRKATSVAKSKFLSWLRATITGGRPFADTVEGFTRIMKSHQARVTKLAENENHRSFLLGIDQATERAKGQLAGTVWLARPNACPICSPRHLTITGLIPISDSHPNCRCIKVPIALDYHGRPVNYAGFLQSIGRR